MVELIKTNEDVKRQGRKAVVGTVVGIVLLCFFIYLITIVSGGAGMMIYFIDAPSLVAVLGIQLIILGASGHFAEFFRSFKLLFSSKSYSDEELMQLSEKSEYALGFGIKATILDSICAVLIGFVVFMHTMSDPATIGPSMAVMVLTFLYACIISLILLIIKGRLHRFHT